MDLTSNFKCNDSILELSLEDLQTELLKSRSSCKVYQQVIEDRNQEVHVLKRQIETLKVLEFDYQQEIEHIISLESKKFKTLQDRIQELETINGRNLSEREETESLERDNQTLKQTITELEKKGNANIPAVDQSEYESVKALIEENEALRAKYDFSYSRYTSKLQEYQQTTAQVEELQEELEESRNTYASNIADTKNKLEEQEEQIALLRIDLANAQVDQNKKEESHESRGNSMFSEIYDNWNLLKEQNKKLVVAYKEARQERNKLRNESAALRRENATMAATWRTEGVEARRNDADLINSYKFAYEKMEDLVKKYEEELVKERNVKYTTSDANVSVYLNMIKSKNEQIEKLFKEFRQANGSTIIHRIEVRDVHDKARKYLAEATRYKNEIELLREQINALQNSDVTTSSGDKEDNDDERSPDISGFSNGATNRVVGAYDGANCDCQPRKFTSNVSTINGDKESNLKSIISTKIMVPQLQSNILRSENADKANTARSTRFAIFSDLSVTETESTNPEQHCGDDSVKENDVTTNIVVPCKTVIRKVKFAESVADSPVNQQRRRPRPKGRPIDCSQMIVMKCQPQTKL